MRGAALSGVFFFASWRLVFSLFLWISTIFLIVLVFKCLKSLALAIKDQGLAVLSLGPPNPQGRPRDQAYTVRAQRSERRQQRGQQTNQRLPPERGLEYFPPNTPIPTQNLEPPPYNDLTDEHIEEPPPAYDSLYPIKDSQRDPLPPV